jgi:hypothetical protein
MAREYTPPVRPIVCTFTGRPALQVGLSSSHRPGFSKKIKFLKLKIMCLWVSLKKKNKNTKKKL